MTNKSSRNNKAMVRSFLGWRVIGFLAVFALLQVSWEAARGSAIERVVIHEATIRPAVFAINSLTPAVSARAEGESIRAPGGGINIRNGCEGLEALFLLIAAFAIAPMSWRNRGIGLLLGTALIYVANQVRIAGLFYAYRADPALFDLLHSTVAPFAVILIVAFYFYVWLARTRRPLA